MRPLTFVLVGCGGFVVQTSVLVLLTGWAGWSIAPAAAIAIESAVLANFVWHERLTWSDRPAGIGDRSGRLIRFHAANGMVSLLGGIAITWAAARYLGLAAVPANALSVVVMAAANYQAADRWVFRNETL